VAALSFTGPFFSVRDLFVPQRAAGSGDTMIRMTQSWLSSMGDARTEAKGRQQQQCLLSADCVVLGARLDACSTVTKDERGNHASEDQSSTF
jgi:hypothetical protein